MVDMFGPVAKLGLRAAVHTYTYACGVPVQIAPVAFNRQA